MDFIMTWASNICATLIFITAVEIILPDNGIKKYCKLVLGLILMIVVINPLVNLLGSGISTTMAVNDYMDYSASSSSLEEYEKKNTYATESKFNYHLKLSLEESLSKEFDGMDFDVEVSSQYLRSDNGFSIKEVTVGYRDKSISRIPKVNVSNKEKTIDNLSQEDISKIENITRAIADITGLPREKIDVYKL